MPDSVDMPAPVKTTVRAEPERSAASREIADMTALGGGPRARGKHIPFNNSKLTGSRHAGILAHHLLPSGAKVSGMKVGDRPNSDDSSGELHATKQSLEDVLHTCETIRRMQEETGTLGALNRTL